MNLYINLVLLNLLRINLQGIIDANVMGGIAKYQEAFFVPEFITSQPEFTEYVYKLRALIYDQVRFLILIILPMLLLICYNLGSRPGSRPDRSWPTRPIRSSTFAQEADGKTESDEGWIETFGAPP